MVRGKFARLARACIWPCAALVFVFAWEKPALADAIQDIRKLYFELVPSGGSNSSALATFSGLFLEIDRDGNGVSLQDIDLVEKVWSAQARSQIIVEKLRYDLDGDLVVTRQEVELYLEYEIGRRLRRTSGSGNAEMQKRELAKRVDKIMKADANGNGQIEGIEMSAVDTERNRDYGGRNWQATLARAMLKADPDGNGVLTEAETFALLGQVFAGLENIAPVRRLGEMAANCPMVAAPKDGKLILFGTYEGASVSTVSVTGQDSETSTATIDVESGVGAVTLVISSYDAMVWQFTGATDRISKVYIGSLHRNPSDDKAAAGVTGLPKAKVEFFWSRNCFKDFYKVESTEDTLAAAQVAKQAGRPVDTIFGTYASDVISVPSGKLANDYAKKEAKSADWLEREMFRFYPGGIDKIDLAKVVSETKAENYQVLPQQAGLLQLIREGALQVDDGGFRILKKIRYPAGLNGAHSVKFILGKGVPIPDGDPGHSRVNLED